MIRLTVLGSSSSIPRPGCACSAYLVESAGSAIVMDLGSGAFANLLHRRAAETIDAVLISHMHADHFIDLIPMRYALKYGERRSARRVPLYLPPGGEATLRTLASAFARESEHDFLNEVFDVRTYDGDSQLAIGDVSVRFAPTTHYIETYAIRCESGGCSVTYSADTEPCDAVVALARDTSIFLCEATFPSAREHDNPRGHTSATGAGRMAHAAGARSLVLTHYPASANPERLIAEARAHFSSDVSIARDDAQFALRGTEVMRGDESVSSIHAMM